MITTKQEVLDIITNNTAGGLLNGINISSLFLSILHWESDHDPRDIKFDDITKLEQQLVSEIDVLLTIFEDKIASADNITKDNV